MKIIKVNPIKIINTNLTTKTSLTKPVIPTKIDMFCKSKEVLEALNNKFINLRDEFSKKWYSVYLKMCDADWNFYINSTDENLETMTKVQDEYSVIFQNKEEYEKFKKISSSKLDKHEQKQLKIILKNFDEELNTGEDLKALRNKENEIAQKYNSYIPKIDGKEVSRTEIKSILKTEQDPEIRRKAYEANIAGADLIAEDLRDFAIMRNSYAVKKGYNNFFEYKLKEDFEVDIVDLENLLSDIYEKSKEIIKAILLKQQAELKGIFGTNDLQSYHYGLLTESNPEKKINDYIKNKEQVVNLSKSAYQGMGWNVDELVKEGKLILDLFPRKGKNTHGFCFGIDASNDARILANLTNNSESLDTLNHEMGHCVYTLGISRDLPFMDRDTYAAMNEAVAMMMGDLHKRENILKGIVSESDLAAFKNYFEEPEACFIARCQLLINFEKEMYKNPNQDLKKLWHDLKVKYQFRSENEELDNGWALIPHYLSHPAYYQNYFRASIIKAQMYNYILSKLGNMTENSKTAEFLNENLFKYGMSLEENELIEKFTGKKLSVDDFVKSIM